MKCQICGCECDRYSNKQKYCIQCKKNYTKYWRKINPEKVKFYRKKYSNPKLLPILTCHYCGVECKRGSNAHKYCRSCRNKIYRNKEKQKEYSRSIRGREVQQNWRDKLNDTYVKINLRYHGIDNPTPEIIKEKRICLKIKRTIKQLKKQNPLL